jgi:predicted amidohydrolase YtcJ
MLSILALFAIWGSGSADLVVTHAGIYTVSAANPVASTIAVKAGNILAMVPDVTSYIGPSTRKILARGAAIVPGFIDAHGHMASLGESLEALDLRGTKSEHEIAEMVRTAASKHKPGEWIPGRAWDQNNWPGRPAPAQVRERLQRAALECARLGITTVHDAGVSAAELDAYRALIRDHQFPIRVYAMIGGEADLWRDYLERGPELGDRLTVRSIKLYTDGALGSRGASLLAPYSDHPPNSGLLRLESKEVERVARDAVAHGFQVNTHAIGDRANRVVLDGYAAALGGANGKCFRIEHAQVVSPEDLPRFEEYSIIASMQPTHATSDMPWAEARLGPDRIKGAYAWRRFFSLGVHLASGSDFPVENPNPLWGFYSAITREDHSGKPAGGWFPGQRMTHQEARRSWTLEGGYAAFEEGFKGLLEPGKAADFVVLSGDIMQIPPAQILETRVTMTVVAGEVVFEQ